jgi:hypothetical protein
VAGGIGPVGGAGVGVDGCGWHGRGGIGGDHAGAGGLPAAAGCAPSGAADQRDRCLSVFAILGAADFWGDPAGLHQTGSDRGRLSSGRCLCAVHGRCGRWPRTKALRR